MNLMLVVIFLCVALGVAVPHFGRREQLAITVIAVSMVTLYYLFPYRFM